MQAGKGFFTHNHSAIGTATYSACYLQPIAASWHLAADLGSNSVTQAKAGSKTATDAPLPSLSRPKPASAEKQALAQVPAPPANAAAIQEAYRKAADAKARGETVEVKVASQNEGGVMVQFGPLRGESEQQQQGVLLARADCCITRGRGPGTGGTPGYWYGPEGGGCRPAAPSLSGVP